MLSPQQDNYLILANMNQRCKVTILKFLSGRNSQTRLASLGILPGIEINIISNNNKGPIIISYNNNKIILGRGIAKKILVKTT